LVKPRIEEFIMACEKHKLNPVKGYSECPGCEVEWLRDRAAKAESLAKRLADDALTSLAGIVCTPAEGYLLAPQCLAADIRNLRKLEEAATKRAISAEKGWQEAIETIKALQPESV
jgi:hypothetical protein